jgi:hypothetical protein
MIGRRRKIPVRRVLIKSFRTQHLLRTVPRSMYSTCPSPSRYQGINSFPHSGAAGGAAAAAEEGGALARPSAPTSTSTRWALVTRSRAMLGTVGG